MVAEIRPYIDIPPTRGGGTSSLLSLTGSRGSATFIEDLGDGTAAVFYPSESQNRVVAPRESGLYYPNAVCPVLIGGDGRVSRIFPPEASGEGAKPYGPSAETVYGNEESVRELEEARKKLEGELTAARGRIDAAQQRAEETASELLDQKAQVLEALDAAFAARGGIAKALEDIKKLEAELTPKLEAAQAKADQAAADLAAEKDRVQSALDKAFAAEGGVAGALENIKKLEAELTPQLEAAQEKANQVAADMEAEKARILAAHNAAMNAQSIADDAIRQAATAAGVAAGKGDVLIQATTPTTAFRLATTLWIDTTGGANTPKRWNGSAWVAVTDKAASDAAAAAAKAASDAALAMTTADGKNKIFYQSTTPTGAKAGDRWYNSTSGKAQVWTGTAWRDTTPGEGFVPALDIGRATVGDMEVGRLKAETSTFGTAVIDKLVADQAFLDRLAVKSSIVVGTADNLFPGMWNDPEGASRWPAGISWTTGSGWVPSGLTGCLKTVAGQGTMSAPATQVEVTPGEEIAFEIWLRTAAADALGSNIYIELRDQAGVLLPSAAYSGGPTTGTYLITNLQVPNAWKKYSVTLKVPTGVSKIGGLRFYFNHTNGSNRNAQIGFALRARRKAGAVLIEDGAVTADQINAESVAGAVGKFVKVQASNLVADDAAMNAAFIEQLVGDSAFFKNIFANRIVVGGDNMVPDPHFSRGSAMWAGISGGSGSGYSTAIAYPGQSQSVLLKQQPTGAANSSLYAPTLVASCRIPVVPGEKYSARAWWYATGKIPTTGNTGSGFSTQIYFYMADGTFISVANGNQTSLPRVSPATHPTAKWFEVGGELVTAPPDAAFASVRPTIYIQAGISPTSANLYLGRVEMRASTGAVLIEDGAVTATKIDVTKELTAKIAKVIELGASRVVADNAAMNAGFIKQLVGDSAFYDNLLAGRIVVAGGNMLKDTTFDKKRWPESSTYTIEPKGGFSGGPAAKFAPSAAQQGIYIGTTQGNANPGLTSDAVPGTKVRVSVWVKSTTAIPANGVAAYVQCWNSAGAATSRGGDWPKAIPANTWTEISAEAKLAANETRIGGYFISRAADSTGDTFFSDPRVIQMSGAVLIEDGAITAEKVLAKSIDVEKLNVTKEMWLKFLTVANATITGKLLADEIESTTTITGATINGGAVQTWGSGARIRLSTQPVAGVGNTPTINLYDNANKNIASLWVDTSLARNPVHANLAFYNANGVERLGLRQKFEETGYRITLRDESGAERVTIDDAAAGGIKVTNPGNGRIAWITGGKIQSTGVYNTTTTAGTNVYIDQWGVFYRNTSVRAAKTDIRPLPTDRRILDVEVVDWIDKAQLVRKADASEYAAQLREGLISQEKYALRTAALPGPKAHLPRIPGVVAEQIESLGLGEFCTYDEDGNLTGVQYERLPLLLIPIVRELLARIQALEVENTELKNRVANLETTLSAMAARLDAANL